MTSINNLLGLFYTKTGVLNVLKLFNAGRYPIELNEAYICWDDALNKNFCYCTMFLKSTLNLALECKVELVWYLFPTFLKWGRKLQKAPDILDENLQFIFI